MRQDVFVVLLQIVVGTSMTDFLSLIKFATI